ncbi:MAG: RNA polymerase sigma factor [Nannocystaceae bacterium]
MRYYQTTERFFRGRIRVVSDAVDLTQQTFLDVAAKHGEIRNFRRFLFRVRSRRLVDYYRRGYREEGKHDTYASTPGRRTGVETATSRNERKLAVREALTSLPTDRYEILWLHYADCLSARKIAELLEVPVGTVKSRLRLGREQLAKKLAPIQTGVPALSELFRLDQKG